MRYDVSYRSRNSMFSGPFPSGVKALIVANAAVYLVYFFGSLFSDQPIFRSLQLVPADVFRRFEIWQLVTYMFLHSLQSFWHILFNMLSLWMFGTPLEQTWGTKRLVQYYFICGIGAGVCVVVMNMLFGDPYQRVLGASGAIYGLLLAYGMMFPDQQVLFSFLFPIKAKYMVMIMGGIAFLSSFQTGGTVSNLAHLGGMLFGFVYLKTQFGGGRRRSVSGRSGGGGFDLSGLDPARLWREYKLKRAKRKFQVYMRKHDSDRGPWVN